MDDRAQPRVVPAWLASRTNAFVPNRALEAAQAFLHTEASGGILLLAATALALIWVNSPLDSYYHDLWSTVIVFDTGLFRVEEDLQHFVNDGLMSIFFFVVGLEIKREISHGELSDLRRATFPAAAALGGMVVPALIYTAFNAGGDGARGWGIPMATDIAFAVGVLSLLSGRIPFSVKIFLLALAIVDDLGAILVIAVFYTEDLALGSLGIAGVLFVVFWLMHNAGARNMLAFLAVAMFLWVAMYKSGVHATIAGVALGMITPSRPYYSPRTFVETVSRLAGHFREAREREDRGDQEAILAEIEELAQGSEAPLERLERGLHPWVSYGVMPIFALANAGVVLNSDVISDAASSDVTYGIILGLVLGKPIGIISFAWLSCRFGVCSLPTGASWSHVVGVGILAGIGFTVSLFITGLAFADPGLVDDAKIGIFFASIVSGVAGFTFLRAVARRNERFLREEAALGGGSA